MSHKAIDLQFNSGTSLVLTFEDGKVIEYDISSLFPKYPQLKSLTDRSLFTTGKLIGGYGVIWNDELDIEAETIYEDGKLLRTVEVTRRAAAYAVAMARASLDWSQKELAEKSGIDQSDISKIERGAYNPSVATLNKLAKAMGKKLVISFED